MSNLLSNAASLGTLEQMDDRGALLNAAFAVSAAFVFGDHLSFTMAYCEEMVPYMILGKLTSGLFAAAAAFWLMKRNQTENPAEK